MNVTQAYEIAAEIVGQMRLYCDKIEIAGSIRRQRVDVKDIEIVVTPLWVSGPEVDLFSGEHVDKRNTLFESVQNHDRIQWIKPGVAEIIHWQIKPDGKYWRGVVDGKIKLDLFLARPENFGLIFLIRTGPAEFSQRFVTQKHKGGTLPNDYRVHEGNLQRLTGEIIPCPTEEEVFRIAGLPFIKPEDRK